jgi:hypothetical protein
MRVTVPFAVVMIVLGLKTVKPNTAAPVMLPIPSQNVIVNDRTTDILPYIAQWEPTLAVFGSRIVVGWNDERYRLSRSITGINSSVGHAFSTDGGSTFTDAGEIGTSHWGADPSVAVDRAGAFYFGRIDLDGIAVYKSTDGGVTFPRSTISSSGLAGIQDKPLIAVDSTGGPFDGNVYASWTNAVSNVLNIRFARSSDGGSSFSNSIPLSSTTLNQGSMTAVGPGGQLYVVWMEAGTKIYVRKSIDGGSTFAPSVLVASVNPIIGVVDSSTAQFCGRTLKGSIGFSNPPIIAVDTSGSPTNGRLYVVFSSGAVPAVYLTSSDDGGQTWRAPSQLNDDATTNDHWLPFVAVAPDGKVATMWYDRRLDAENLLFDVFMAISVDGGSSFGPNVRITEVSSPPPGINNKLGFPPYTCYFSSYSYMVADATSFYLVWTDNRMVNSGRVDPNIVFAKVAARPDPLVPRLRVEPPPRRSRLPRT